MAGVTIVDTLVTSGVGNYPITKDTDVLGGYSVVADHTARDAIRTGVRKQGMLVRTLNDEHTFELQSDLTTWFDITSTGALTGDVTIKVSSSGSDSNAARPSIITSGDWTVYPFLTLPVALASLPRACGTYRAIILVDTGTYGGTVISGFLASNRTFDMMQDYALRIKGTWSLATATTGVNSFTPSAATATVLTKPAAAANWTVSEHRNRWVRIVSGTGAYSGAAADQVETIAQIKDNDATTLTLNAAFIYYPNYPNVAPTTPDTSTTVVQIIVPGTTLNKGASSINGRVLECQNIFGAISIEALDFDQALPSASSSGLGFKYVWGASAFGCQFKTANATRSMTIQDCNAIFVDRITIDGPQLGPLANNCNQLNFTNWQIGNSAAYSVSNILSMSASNMIAYGGNLTGGTIYAHVACNTVSASSLVAQNFSNATIIGLSALQCMKVALATVTGSGNAGRGMYFDHGGDYNVPSSCTLTGSLTPAGDMLVGNVVTTYAALATALTLMHDNTKVWR